MSTLPALKRARIACEQYTSCKRIKSAIDKSLEEFVCPITRDLPFHPVLAEDAKVYERSAIETWFKFAPTPLRSPVTKEPMGTKLVPACHIKNFIERMAESGALAKEKAAAWSKRTKDQAKVEELRGKMRKGEASAALSLGIAYYFGKYGLMSDVYEAIRCYEQAAKSGSVEAMGRLASTFFHGSESMSKCEARALRWSSAAAVQGDALGLYTLGNCYMYGAAGLPVDVKEGLKLMTDGAEASLKTCAMNCSAYVTLALLYANQITPVDTKTASKWMRVAVRQGESACENTMHAQQTYLELARDWLSKHGQQAVAAIGIPQLS